MGALKFIFFAFLILNGIKGAVDLSAANDKIAETNAFRGFVYDNASPEKREAWLQRYATVLADGIEKGATAPSAPQTGFVSISSEVDANRKAIRVTQIIDQETPPLDVRLMARKTLLEQSCNTMISSPVGKEGVTVEMRIRTKTGGRYISVDFTPDTCAPYLEAA